MPEAKLRIRFLVRVEEFDDGCDENAAGILLRGVDHFLFTDFVIARSVS